MSGPDETADALRVEQVDRDAAANLSLMPQMHKADVRAGKADLGAVVQAFARHRIAALSDRAAELEGETISPAHFAHMIWNDQPQVLTTGQSPTYWVSLPQWAKDFATAVAGKALAKVTKAEGERDAAWEAAAKIADRQAMHIAATSKQPASYVTERIRDAERIATAIRAAALPTERQSDGGAA